jgi:type II secretory pathway component GspD/PulD (secretin)
LLLPEVGHSGKRGAVNDVKSGKPMNISTQTPPAHQRYWLAILALLCALVAAPAFGQSGSVEIVPLRYRTAEQIIPVLKPLLDSTGTITGMQNQLIIRTSPANLAQLKQVLASLDTMPRRLMITVRQDADLERERAGAEISGRVSSGNTTVVVPGSRGGTNVEVRRGDDVVRGRVESTRSAESDSNVQTLQVLEGNSAFIRIGQSVPVTQRQITRTVVNGRIVEQVGSSVDYRDVMTGFHALPRLSGDRVTVEISPQRDTLARPEQNLPRGSVNVQGASTVVSGRLGEWMEIGGIAQGGSDERSALLGTTRTQTADNRRILIKVEEMR